MRGLLRHPARVLVRLIWLAWVISTAALRFACQSPFGPQRRSLAARSRWLQRSCQRTLRVLATTVHAEGEIPHRGLLVCNHLSYLDIIVLSALTPAVFVAKREVKHWPVFGWFAQLGGTLFVDRERRTKVGEFNSALDTVLGSGVLVILFPEGTSSDGQTVLPFKSSLLEPAASGDHPLFAGHIDYHLEDGDVGEEVCYWKDMTFAPHLVNLMSKRRVEVRVRFTQLQRASTERKVLATQLREEVLKLKHSSKPLQRVKID